MKQRKENRQRQRDALVMLLIMLTAVALAMVSYGRMRVHQDVRALTASPPRR